MIDEILSRASKVSDSAEVFQVNAAETPVSFETNRLKQITTRQSKGVSLRLIRNGKLGFATASGAVKPQDLVKRAAEAAEFGAQAHFELPPSYSQQGMQIFDPEVEKLSQDKMVGMGQGLIDSVCKHNSELKCDARVVKAVIDVNIANSRGSAANYKKSIFHIEVEGTLIRGTDMLFVGDGDTSCNPVTDYRQIASAVIEQLELAKENVSMSTKILPAIFTPHGVVSALLSPLVTAFNGRVVFQGASPLGHRKGEKVFQNNISLWDDATVPFKPSSRPWDDEGIPSQRNSLIEKGVVSNFLYDLQTGGLAKAKSTGNASRAMGGMPAPMASALIISAGETSLEDMLNSMEEGLLIEHLMGAEQGNVMGGDFSGNVLLGYRVEKGKVVGRVKNAIVAGNIYELLRDGAILSKDSRWVYGHLNTPYIYVSRLSVAGKG